MRTREAVQVALALVLALAAAPLCGPEACGEDLIPEIPSHLPNPYKKKTTYTPVDVTKDLKLLEGILYGEVNEGNTEDGRLAALERTVFGATYSKNSIKTRLEGLARVVNHIVAGRKFYDAKQFQDAKTEFDETLRLIGGTYKSTAKAEIYYRLGMCNYELSNIRTAGPQNPSVRLNGVMLRAAKENLTKAQEYYKSLGEPETSQKITAFIDTFRDKASMSFLY
jgi:hypothetical protein